jgi:hypothetical protein
MPQKKSVLVERLGTNQVDEVVISPEMTPFDGFPQNGAAMHTSANQALSKGLIERCLDDVDMQYGRDHDGDIVTRFSGDELGGDLIAWFLIVGEKRDIFRLLCTVEHKVPQSKWTSALLACNEYHNTARFGRAYLNIKKDQPEADLYFDSQIDLTEGVTEASLQGFIMQNLLGAHVFFEKAYKDKALFVDHQPKPTRKRRSKIA